MEEWLDDVPEWWHTRFLTIVELTDRFCDACLDDEYKELAREMAVALCQDGSPAMRGKAESWACGIIYALGQVNFLSDPDTEPCMASVDVAKGFGVSQATMQAKAKVLRESLELMPMHPRWCVTSRLDENPLVWMIEVDGLILDVRNAPREVQEAAYEQGLIPWIPADRAGQPDRSKPDIEPKGVGTSDAPAADQRTDNTDEIPPLFRIEDYR